MMSCHFEEGERLHFRRSTGAWMPCEVVHVRSQDGAMKVDVETHHWFTKSEQLSKFRRSCIAMGDVVEYCESDEKWVDAQVVDVRDRDGAATLNIAGSRWFTV